MIELDEYELDDSEDFPTKNTRRSLRRAQGKKKKRKLINETSCGCNRCISFVLSDEKGNYIKRKKHSDAQRFLKKQSAKRWRKCGNSPTKGNYYRRLLDYWDHWYDLFF